jgi:D-tyrosyl-tRNA(Tyr) deacylase
MRAVVQRVNHARVTVENETIGAIRRGIVVLLGIEDRDTEIDESWMAEKLAHLRIFEDDDGRMNCSVLDAQGGILLVPNFTVAGSCRKGRRPSFDHAADPDIADARYGRIADRLRDLGLVVELGRFRAHMHVELTNDGPVTLIVESPRRDR